MIGHRLMGTALMSVGNLAEGRTHFDQAIALFDPAEHRPLATRFGQDVRVSILAHRSRTLWLLGYPEAARADSDFAVNDAREIGHAASLMYALYLGAWTHTSRGNYAAANTYAQELTALGHENSASLMKAWGTMSDGGVLILTGRASDAIETLISGLTASRPTGTTIGRPIFLAWLARAYAELGQFDDAWRCVGDAMMAVETTKERWFEAEIHRTAGEILMLSSEMDVAKVQARFQRALAIARDQRAKSYELRAAMSMARLWRDQGERQQARDLLAPVYGWFTEGFDTADLKQAKALLDALS